jgi:hypothetical protein
MNIEVRRTKNSNYRIEERIREEVIEGSRIIEKSTEQSRGI